MEKDSDTFGAIEHIENKTDFISFLLLLSKDFKTNSQDWPNQNIPAFLEQMAGWIEDYSACPANDVDWESVNFKVLAQILYMGKLYE